MHRKWNRIILLGLFLIVVGFIINRMLTQKYASDYAIHSDMLNLCQALAMYANANDGKLPKSWVDLESTSLVTLGQKNNVTQTSTQTGANRIEHPERCHWQYHSVVNEYRDIIMNGSITSRDFLLVYNDDLSFERNLVYNKLLLQSCE